MLLLFLCLLKISGKAQRESSWSRKSDWGKIWRADIPLVAKSLDPKSNAVSIHRTLIVHLGWVNMSTHNFLLVDQSLSIFCF